jgi:hypothetical protein
LDHCQYLGLSAMPDFALCNICTVPSWWSFGIRQILGRWPFSTVELFAIGLGGCGIDVLVLVQIFLDHVRIGLGFVHVPNGQKLIIEFTLQTAERVPIVVFIVGSSSSQITLHH